jgi:IS5 family transposase
MAGFMGGKQLGFGDYEQTTAKKRTKRERFLGQMQAVVPWKALIDLIEPSTPRLDPPATTAEEELLFLQAA